MIDAIALSFESSFCTKRTFVSVMFNICAPSFASLHIINKYYIIFYKISIVNNKNFVLIAKNERYAYDLGMNMYKNVKIHFVGIGGASMSALAEYVLLRGGQVSGSDRTKSQITDNISKECKVVIGEDPSLVDGVDMVVYTSAVSPQNKELCRARALNVPTLERKDFLALVAKDFQRTIAVAGTHGKTTVTALIIHLLKSVGAFFSAHVGGDTEYGNFVLDGEDIFVTEACEYKSSLLSLTPAVSVVLNAELDHPDCYKTLKDLTKVFLSFLSKGLVQIVSGEFLNVCKNEHICNCKYERNLLKYEGDVVQNGVYAFSNGKVDIWTYERVLEREKTTPKNHSQMVVFKNGHMVGQTKTYDSNPHTPLNVLVAIAVLDMIGIEFCQVSNNVESFGGVKRRNQLAGKINGAQVVFDYAHHPTQIRGMLAQYEGKKLVVFQPHTYSRTKAYFDDFVRELSRADKLIIMATYGAREVNEDGVDGDALVAEILTKFAKHDVYHLKTTDEVLEMVRKLCFDMDYALFLGAGDIYDLMSQLDYD